MARTQKDTVSYFPHDADASAGDTLMVLQSQFGNDGYAFWFKLLERLASTEGHFIDCNNHMRWQLLLAKLGVNDITGVEMMKLLVEMQAIDKELWEQGIIWCQKLVDNIADVYKNRRREIPSKPLSTGLKLITTPPKLITTGVNTQSKVKEIKGKETKEEDVSLSIEDVYEVYKKEIMGSLDESASIPEDIEKELELATKKFTAPWVIAAIREGVKRKAKSWRYITMILSNWAREEREAKFPANKGPRGKQDPDKYIKGKYGHMVQR